MAVWCEERGYLFLLAPRTASTATAKVLVEDGGGVWIPPDDIEIDGEIVVQRKHTTAQQLVDHGLLSAGQLGRLFVFTTVRNPYDSLVSLWTKKRTSYQPLLDDPDSWVNRIPGFREDMIFVRDHSFSEWIEWDLGDCPPRSMYAEFADHADAVMRFERLSSDFPRVTRRIGLRRLRELPVWNPTEARGSADHRDYYTPNARRIVTRVYRPDLERFGYRF